MAPVIEVEGLAFRYPGAEVDSLTGVDLVIERGDFVAVVGGNGSGKTTLCKSLNGLIPHFWAGRFDGSVRVAGVDTRDSSVASLSSLVGYVYQDFGNQLIRPTVRQDVEFGPINFGLEDFADRSAEALDQLGIGHLASTFIWQLSGGQQHLTALAGVLAMRPQVIVVDEPVAELDPARAEEVYRMLTRINHELGTTVVVIEHHAEFIARYARSVALMADGALRWHLPTREALGRADELEAHGIPAPQVVEAVRRIAPGAEVPLTVAEATETLRPLIRPQAEAPPLPAEVSPGLHDATGAPGAPGAGNVVASLRAVGYGYRDVHNNLETVLDAVSLDLHEGERVAVVGSNGAGKSTLLRLLTGLVVPRSGEVEIEGVNTRSKSPAELADRVSYLHQHPEQMFLKDSVRSDIAMFPHQRGRPGTDELVDRILDQLSLDHLAERDGRTLSGGQQRRATLGIGLAMTPTLLLLDEPTSSLDVRTRQDVTAMLATLAERIRCVVVATHDMHLVAEWATRVIVLHAGGVLADTTPATLFDDPGLLASVNLVAPQVTLLGHALGVRPAPLCVDDLVRRTIDADCPVAGAT
ncbi:MAG: ABC transporter ATP-binding protein [Acidimicrobiales bacterium]